MMRFTQDDMGHTLINADDLKNGLMAFTAQRVDPDRLVPLLWPGGTVVCLASGPSLTEADVTYVCGRAPVIAINAAIQLAPWADVFYSGAPEYWTPDAIHARESAGFAGLSVRLALNEGTGPGQMRKGITPEGIIVLSNTGENGVETRPDGIRTQKNSGGAAINVAVHLGATRIILLGYDMRPDARGRHHFWSGGKENHFSPYDAFRSHMATMVAPLAALGVEVINCTRSTALTCFPRKPLEEVL